MHVWYGNTPSDLERFFLFAALLSDILTGRGTADYRNWKRDNQYQEHDGSFGSPKIDLPSVENLQSSGRDKTDRESAVKGDANECGRGTATHTATMRKLKRNKQMHSPQNYTQVLWTCKFHTVNCTSLKRHWLCQEKCDVDHCLFSEVRCAASGKRDIYQFRNKEEKARRNVGNHSWRR